MNPVTVALWLFPRVLQPPLRLSRPAPAPSPVRGRCAIRHRMWRAVSCSCWSPWRTCHRTGSFTCPRLPSSRRSIAEWRGGAVVPGRGAQGRDRW